MFILNTEREQEMKIFHTLIIVCLFIVTQKTGTKIDVLKFNHYMLYSAVVK